MECVKCPNPMDYSIWEPVSVIWTPRTILIDLVEQAQLGDDVVVYRNGDLEVDYSLPVKSNDQITILPKVKGPLVALLPILASMAASWGATAAAFTIAGLTVTQTAALIGMATMIIGGLVMNMLMPQPGTPDPGDQSPSYGFSGGYNVRREGLPIPVHWGNCQITPPLIGEYSTVDNDTSDMTYNGLYGISEGLTDQVLIEDSITINDEPLTSFEDYEIEVTKGENSPETGSLSFFDKIHQYRKLYKVLSGSDVSTSSILHLNGDHGSVVITDEIAGNTWTCQGTASLSTANPFLGTAALDCLAAGEYVDSTDDLLNWMGDLIFEVRFRLPDLLDHGIFSQVLTYAMSEVWLAGLIYKSGNLQFLIFRDDGTGVVNYESVVSINVAVTAVINTWHHVCVQVQGDTFRLYFDGVQVGEADRTVTLSAYVDGALQNVFGLDGFLSGVTSAIQLGKGATVEGGVRVDYDGLCEIDEFRSVNNQTVYDWDGFTPPIVELTTSTIDSAQTVTTRGAVDAVNVIIECPRGLYHTSKEGDIESLTLNFNLDYRIPGGSWNTTAIQVKDNSTYAVRRQFPLTFTSRKIREIRLTRLTTDYNSTKVQGTSYWIGLDEIVDEWLLYPNMQCLALRIKATDQLTSIPTVKVVANRTEIQINESMVDATNPERIAEDIITNTLYGGGEAYSRLDVSSSETWRDWCDGIITGTTKRATFNGVFDTEKSMAQALSHICDVGRAHFVPHGTKIRWVIEKTAQPADMYCARSIIPKTSKLHWIDITQKVDGHLVEYVDRDREWSRQAAFWPSRNFDSLDRPANIARLFLLGINNYDEALRQAILRQQLTDDTLTDLEFQSGIKAMAVLPGDVIWYSHYGHDLMTSGAVMSVEDTASIKIDEEITLDAATYLGVATMWLQDQNDVIYEIDITGPFDEETDTFNLAEDVPASIQFGDAYFIGRSSEDRLKYRFSKVVRGNNSSVKMRCVEYNEDAYYCTARYGDVEI